MISSKKIREFVSSIKIKGISLLPPVISEERRVELQKDREKAIQIEKELQYKQSLKFNLHEVSFSPQNNPEENTFFADVSDHIDKLGILDNAPLGNESSNISHLPKDIEFKDDSNRDSDASNETIVSDKSSKLDCIVTDLSDPEPLESPHPRSRLIRSNSYTLESPSPVLLAHMKHEKHQSFASRNWSSIDNGYIPFNCTNTIEDKETELKSSTPKDLQNTVKPIKNDNSVIEVVQTDLTVKQITVNSNFNENTSSVPNDNSRLHSIINDATKTTNIDTEAQLFQLLQNIPENYSKQIIDLLEKQKREQQEKLQSYEKLKSELLENNPVQSNILNASFVSCNTSSVSPSQSIYYTVTSSDDTIKTGSEKPSNQSIRGGNVTFNRELFPEVDSTKIREDKERWAASIISAHVKGYLTRRLLKTDKVQDLIQTIKDALLCALQLHNSENIDEYDVELHRRLIQQVSAACHAFHGLFFELSVKEQMQIISGDRQHKLEKANRPKSAPNSGRSSNLSSKSRTSYAPPKQSKSLTSL